MKGECFLVIGFFYIFLRASSRETKKTKLLVNLLCIQCH